MKRPEPRPSPKLSAQGCVSPSCLTHLLRGSGQELQGLVTVSSDAKVLIANVVPVAQEESRRRRPCSAGFFVELAGSRRVGWYADALWGKAGVVASGQVMTHTPIQQHPRGSIFDPPGNFRK